MIRKNRHLTKLVVAGLTTIMVAGCDAAYRSSIDVTLCKRARSEGVTERNVLRQLLTENGYAIRERVEGDPFIKEEIGGEKFKDIWSADKKSNPTVIFAQGENHSTIRLFQLSGPVRPRTITELTDKISSRLVSLCGAKGVEVQQY